MVPRTFGQTWGENCLKKYKKQNNMETLIKELKVYKKSLSAEEKVQLSDSVLDKLYAP